MPGDGHFTLVGRIKRTGQMQKRALAAAGFTGQRQALPGGQIEIDGVQHRKRPLRRLIPLGDGTQRKHHDGKPHRLKRTALS